MWSQEPHVKAEKTKRENGTDLGNTNFRKHIGCNGNPQEIINKWKELGIGIFSNDIRNNHKPGFCVKCGQSCQHRNAFGVVGIECGCLGKQLTEEHRPKFCETCQKITPHNEKICLVCHPESKCTGIRSFIELDNILCYYDRTVSSYVPWPDYKSKFSVSFSLELADFISDLQKSFPSAILIPTFRTQDSDSWTGSRAAFEMSLTECNIFWFAYIKFYVDHDGLTKPLVVGKSGSTLVNSAGSDINFSTDVNDGPARRFLHDEGLHWDKTQLIAMRVKRRSIHY